MIHTLTSRNILLFLLITMCSGARGESINFATISVGADSDSGDLYNVYIDLALNEEFRFQLGHGENTSETADGEFTTRQDQIGFTGQHKLDGQSALNWSVSHSSWGAKESIETQDNIFSIGYFFNSHWNVSLDYETGSLELFIRPEFSNRASSVKSERNAWRLTTGYTHQTGNVWISLLQRQYDKNLPALNERRNLQRAFKSIALDAAFALSKEELSFGYEWLFETMDLGLDYNRIISVVDNHKNVYTGLYSRFYVGQNLTVNLRLEKEVNDDFTVFTAGLGYAW